MPSDPASAALVAIAAICGTLATVGLLRRAQQAGFARRAAQGADRALLREYEALRAEIAALVEQLEGAVDRLIQRLDAGDVRPMEAQDARRPAEPPGDVRPAVHLGAEECAANLRRYAESQ